MAKIINASKWIKDRSGLFAYTDAEGRVQRGKTLWDWLGLLIIPIMLALGTFWLSNSNRQSDLALAEQRSQEEKLNAYLEKMEEYILDRGLSGEFSWEQENPSISRVARVAQVQTVTALRSMDQGRRAAVIQFLRDAGLIGYIFVDASMAGIDLSQADLRGANLYGADLEEADLRGADLSGAILRYADLIEAYLLGADLSEACLVGTVVTEEQLDSALSFAGAIMPDEDAQKCLEWLEMR